MVIFGDSCSCVARGLHGSRLRVSGRRDEHNGLET
jgi:hypothetical protein